MTIEMIAVYVALMAISAIVGFRMGHGRATTLTISKLIANKYVAYTKDEITGNVDLIEHPEARNNPKG